MNSERPLFPAATPAISIRLLWAFSFHGRGKVWAGEKQLRRLSTCCSTHCKALLRPSKQNNIHRFSTKSKWKSKEILNPQCICWSLASKTSTDVCSLPFSRVAPRRAAQQGLSRALTCEFLNSHVRLSQTNQGKALSPWVCCFSSPLNRTITQIRTVCRPN